ncbi:MAG: hypothetical protein RI922_1358 [Bacteroidota bacterium]|jgi:uncharacterized C2H2 Zn-finger protein
MTFKEFSDKYPNKGLNDYYIFLNANKTNLMDSHNQSSVKSAPSNNEQYNYSTSQLNKKNAQGNSTGTLVLVLSIAILLVSIYTGLYGLNVITGIIVIYGYFTSCPSCGGWFVREKMNSSELNRESGYKDVKRVDKIKDMSGRQIAQNERYEQVHVTRITYLNTYCCRNCNYQWQSKSIEEKY